MREHGARSLKTGDVQIVLGPLPSPIQRLAAKAAGSKDEAERQAIKDTMKELEKREEKYREEEDMRDLIAAAVPDAPPQLVDKLLGRVPA